MSRFLMVLVAVGGCIPRLETENGPSSGGDWVAPDNAWPMAEPPADLVAEGFGTGEVAPDLRLVDQAGDEVSLWQFHGSVVLLDISTIWCVPCQALAQHTEATWQTYRDQGFVYVTVLQQDNEGNAPDGADLDAWATAFGITAPVVADGEETAIDAVPLVGGSRAYPGVLVIDRDMVVRKAMEVPTAEDVDEAIDEVL
jgi:peroxiredoxin